jgi:hypothetical protein
VEPVLRAAAVHLFLVVALKIAGRRSLAPMTAFERVRLLIVGAATQQALFGDDFSLTHAALSLVERRSTRAQRLLDGVPTVLVRRTGRSRGRLSRSCLRPHHAAAPLAGSTAPGGRRSPAGHGNRRPGPWVGPGETVRPAHSGAAPLAGNRKDAGP